MSFADRLKKLRERWKKEAPATGFAHPLGEFQGRIEKAVFEVGKKGKRKGHSLINLGIVGITGEARGKRTQRTHDLDQDQGIAYFKKDLKNIGLDIPKKLTEETLKAVLQEMLDVVIDYTVQQRDQWLNTFINRAVNAPVSSGGDEAEPIEDDEEYEDTIEEEEEDDEQYEEDEEVEEKEEESPIVTKKKTGKVASKKKSKKKAAKKAEPEEDEDAEDWNSAEW